MQFQVEQLEINQNSTQLSQELLIHIKNTLFAQKDIHSLMQSYHKLAFTLKRLDIIKTANLSIDKLSSLGYTLKLDLIPQSKIRAKTGTTFNEKGGDFYLDTKILNVLGAGQSLDAKVSYNIDPNFGRDTRFHLAYAVPALSLDQRYILSARREGRILGARIIREQVTGLNATYEIDDGDFAKHALVAGYDVRENTPMRHDIEASIKDSGLHLKTFVGYNYSLDTTDAPVLPTKGIRASLKTQFAGLIGNIGLIKGEASISAAHHLLNGITLVPTIKAGLALPISSTEQVRINDKFFLGGSTSIRGYPHHSLGPRESPNIAVGGDAYYACGCSLMIPLPTLREAPIRLNAFWNLGKLVGNGLRDWQRFKQPCLSVGGGVLVDFAGIRVEVNYVLPIVSEDADAKPGLAFGVGVDFL